MKVYLFSWQKWREQSALFKKRPLCMLLTSASERTLSFCLSCYKDTCLVGSSEVIQDDDFSVTMLVWYCAVQEQHRLSYFSFNSRATSYCLKDLSSNIEFS